MTQSRTEDVMLSMRAGKRIAKSLLLLLALSLLALGLRIGTNEVEALSRLIAVSIIGT